MNWIECSSCEEEFRVISDTGPTVAFCPFCGATVEEDAEGDEDFFEDEDED